MWKNGLNRHAEALHLHGRRYLRLGPQNVKGVTGVAWVSPECRHFCSLLECAILRTNCRSSGQRSFPPSGTCPPQLHEEDNCCLVPSGARQCGVKSMSSSALLATLEPCVVMSWEQLVPPIAKDCLIQCATLKSTYKHQKMFCSMPYLVPVQPPLYRPDPCAREVLLDFLYYTGLHSYSIQRQKVLFGWFLTMSAPKSLAAVGFPKRSWYCKALKLKVPGA